MLVSSDPSQLTAGVGLSAEELLDDGDACLVGDHLGALGGHCNERKRRFGSLDLALLEKPSEQVRCHPGLEGIPQELEAGVLPLDVPGGCCQG